MPRPLIVALLVPACQVAEEVRGTEGLPSGRLASADRAWTAEVAPGGALTVVARDGGRTKVDVGVDPRLAFSPDGASLVYSRVGPLGESDLWRVALPDGRPTPVTEWVGSEDRPVYSPDGRRLAFVSGRTGIASWWVIQLDGSGARQVTNIGVEARPRAPGAPPEGFLPVPDVPGTAWTDQGLSWQAGGNTYTVVP